MNNEFNQETPPQNNEQYTPSESRPIESEPIALPIVPVEHKWYQNKLLLVLVIFVVALLGAGAGYAYYQVTKPAETPVVKSTPKPSETPKAFAPYAVVYAADKSTKSPKTTCLVNETTVLQQELTKDTAAQATVVADGQIVTGSEIQQGNVLLVTTPTCVSKTPASILYSNDAGKTYSALYTVPTASGTEGAITSAMFTDDGKTILFAELDAKANKNTVKELTVASKEVKDIFTAKEDGVYFHGYDKAIGKIYYHESCYGCDATVESDLTVYDIKTKKSEVFSETQMMYKQTVMNDDASKGVRLKQGALGAVGSPDFNKVIYGVELLDIKTKKVKDVASINADSSKGETTVGFTSKGAVYYTNNDSIYLLDGKDKPSLLMKASQPIIAVHYIGDDQIIYSMSEGQQKNSSVMKYDVAAKKWSTLLNTTPSNTVIGVSLK